MNFNSIIISPQGLLADLLMVFASTTGNSKSIAQLMEKNRIAAGRAVTLMHAADTKPDNWPRMMMPAYGMLGLR